MTGESQTPFAALRRAAMAKLELFMLSTVTPRMFMVCL